MKLLFKALSIVFFSVSAHAFTIQSSWNSKLQRDIVIHCDLAERDLCEQESSSVRETWCRSCIGLNSKFMYELFSGIENLSFEMDKPVDLSEVLDFLRNNSFVTIDKRSIYNFYLDWADLDKKMTGLCPAGPDEGVEVLLFIQSDPASHIPQEIRYVSCTSSTTNKSLVFRRIITK